MPEPCVGRRDFLKGASTGTLVYSFAPSLFAAALSAGGRPKTLVLGGGAFALGYALAHPKETLVLERGIHLGLDYAGTTGPVAPGTPTTEIGRELIAKMSEAQILKDGAMELPPLADFLAQFFHRDSFAFPDLLGRPVQHVVCYFAPQTADHSVQPF